MNRKEFLESGGHSIYHYKVTKLLKQWKLENNITERCVVHHRDDTEEFRKYNEEHYELFGFEIDENGILKFEEGKYVQFMTLAKHNTHHNKGKPALNKGLSLPNQSGENHHLYGKHHSEESKRRISSTLKGRKLPQETKDKMSEAHKGHIRSDDHCKHLSDALQTLGMYYKQYKACGGTLSWNEFKHALKIGKIKYTEFI